MDARLSTTPEELFMLLGEAHFVKYRQAEEIKKLYTQIDEMANRIIELNAEKLRLQVEVANLKEVVDGKLGQPVNNDAV